MLSKIRSYIVSGDVLTTLAQDISLHQYIILGKGEKQNKGQFNHSNLANCFEALVGAIYLDAGLPAAMNFVIPLFKEKITEAVSSNIFYDYKSSLQEKCLKKFKNKPTYTLIEEKGLEHQKVFCMELVISGTSICKAWGASKKKAEQNVAKACLESNFFSKDKL